MKQYLNKKYVMPIISIIFILLLVIGVSYAVFSVTRNGTKNNVINAGTLTLTFTDNTSNNINLQNAVPVTDATGMNSTPYTFTITNTGTIPANYELLIEEDQALYTQHKDTGKIFPDNKLSILISKTSGSKFDTLFYLYSRQVLDSGRIEPGESVSYTARIWINYNAGNEVQGNHFHGKFMINALQTAPATASGCFTTQLDGSYPSDYALTITDYTCSSKDVVIPRKIDNMEVTAIDTNAFQNKGLTSIVFDKSITYDKDSFRGNNMTGEKAFFYEGTTLKAYGGSEKNIVIPDKTTAIDNFVFQNLQLTGVTIPANVTSIGIDAFAGNQLTSVTIKGKSSTSDFAQYGEYGTSPFGWASGYSDSNITWIP